MKRDLTEADLRALRSQLEGERDHPDLEQELFLYVDGTLPPERQAAIGAHLETCARCREDVSDLAAVKPRAVVAPPRRWPSYAAAAALVAAMAGAGTIFLLREPRPEADPQPVAVAEQPAPSPAVPAADPLPPVTASQGSAEPARAAYARREWQKLVSAARDGSRLMMPAVLQALRPGSDHLRGTQNAKAKMQPAGVVVETQRPTFTWPAREGSRSVVSVFEGGKEIVRSEPRSVPRWKPNRDLPRGVTYTWEVEVEQEGKMEILPSPPTPQAKFRVLDSDALVEIDEARRQHADDHLLLGILLAKAGLDDEAREELQRVGPNDAAIARRLLADIDTWDSRQ